MALHTSALSDAAGERFPLSAAQRGIWFAQKVSKSVPINIAQFVEIDGELDADVFAEDVQATARELHSPYLRLVEVDGRPMQLVDTGAGYDGSVVDFCSEPDPAAAALGRKGGKARAEKMSSEARAKAAKSAAAARWKKD